MEWAMKRRKLRRPALKKPFTKTMSDLIRSLPNKSTATGVLLLIIALYRLFHLYRPIS